MGDDRASLDLLRRRVVNVVGHELRTPITTLRGLAELLGATDDDPERTADLHEAIRRAARRAEALVDDLLVASGIGTALPVGDPVATDVVDAVAAAWGGLDDTPADVDLGLDVADGVAVLARPGALERALAAVLDNAVRHGAPPVDLRVAVGADGRIEIVVSDAGPGVLEAERELVVEPFFRAERAVLRGPGLGLGLALAAELVRHDSGSLVVGPGPDGAGCAVTIVLPGAP